MIYLISDPHGGESMDGLNRYLSIAQKEDYLIILGDLGLKFQDNEENARFTSWFLDLNLKIAIVKGNHENHAFLNSFPEEPWCGGTVNRLSKSIVRLKCGNIFSIDGKSFFVMGGCKSSARWKEWGLWFPGEEPTVEELTLAYKNLQHAGNRVDYVLTHKYVDYRQENADAFSSMSLEGLTRYVDENVTFGHWYAGHWHENRRIDEKHTLVYDAPVALP